MEKYLFELKQSFKITNDELDFQGIRNSIIGEIDKNGSLEEDKIHEYIAHSILKLNHSHKHYYEEDWKDTPNFRIIDYQEEEGSLIIKFTILFVSTLMVYGAIRQSIDYAIDDIKRLLKANSNSVSSGQQIEKTLIKTNWIDRLQPLNLKSMPLITIVIIFLSLIFSIFFVVIDNRNRNFEETKNQNILLDNLKSELERLEKLDEIDEKLNYLIINDSISQKKDTTFIN